MTPEQEQNLQNNFRRQRWEATGMVEFPPKKLNPPHVAPEKKKKRPFKKPEPVAHPGKWAKHLATEIIQEAARLWNCSPKDIRGRFRLGHVAQARLAAMAVHRKVSGLTAREVGLLFKRHHANILHATKAARNYSEQDRIFKARHETLLEFAQGVAKEGEEMK